MYLTIHILLSIFFMGSPLHVPLRATLMTLYHVAQLSGSCTYTISHQSRTRRPSAARDNVQPAVHIAH